jgi:hypothetical protein
MSLEFEWDEAKAKGNLKKHGVSFEEASSIFGDPLALTIPDPLHSEEEDRFLTLANRIAAGSWSCVRPTGVTKFASSARGWRRAARGRTMKKAAKSKRDPDMLDEYDFSAGVRGKYAKRYAEGTNVVVLAPDVAAAFPDAQSVNDALRALVQIARRNGKKAKP